MNGNEQKLVLRYDRLCCMGRVPHGSSSRGVTVLDGRVRVALATPYTRRATMTGKAMSQERIHSGRRCSVKLTVGGDSADGPSAGRPRRGLGNLLICAA